MSEERKAYRWRSPRQSQVMSKTERLKMLCEDADAVRLMLARPGWGSADWEDRLKVRLDRIRDLTDISDKRKGEHELPDRRVYAREAQPIA